LKLVVDGLAPAAAGAATCLGAELAGASLGADIAGGTEVDCGADFTGGAHLAGGAVSEACLD
jgi:hypothetical protein